MIFLDISACFGAIIGWLTNVCCCTRYFASCSWGGRVLRTCTLLPRRTRLVRRIWGGSPGTLHSVTPVRSTAYSTTQLFQPQPSSKQPEDDTPLINPSLSKDDRSLDYLQLLPYFLTSPALKSSDLWIRARHDVEGPTWTPTFSAL